MDIRTDQPPQPLYVYPGHVLTSSEGRRLTTVLGSCVSVCLFDPDCRVGGMTHFLLPDPFGADMGSPRFAGPAIRQLVQRLLGLGAESRRLVAKVFGGSGAADEAAGGLRVGQKNIDAARRALREERIPILTEDVGGSRGRRLVFHTDDGTAWVKAL